MQSTGRRPCNAVALSRASVMQPVKMPTRPYPMSKIVGQDMVKLALLLAAGEAQL